MDNKIIFTIMDGYNTHIPVRAHSTDAGIDVFYPNNLAPVKIRPNSSVLLATGLKMAIPSGYALIAFNKSGVAAKKHLILGSCVIDSEYRGQIFINLNNIGSEEQIINPGEKITQLILVPVMCWNTEMVNEEEYNSTYANTERGEGGFGSTGTF